jgi:hypothetical protein
MGYGKMNVWVRNEKCDIVDRRGHLHIYNCQGTQIIPTLWFTEGHAEVKVPPGCYIVTAGVVYGNVYTDKTMVVVGCGEVVCVNLVLNKFREEKAKKKRPVLAMGCAARIAAPLALNAIKAKIDPEELRIALDLTFKAANLDKREMLDSIQGEITELEQNMNMFKETELIEVKEYLDSLHQLSKLIG